jgi:hypothetical protein
MESIPQILNTLLILITPPPSDEMTSWQNGQTSRFQIYWLNKIQVLRLDLINVTPTSTQTA